LVSYEEATRMQGPPFVLLVLLALVGPPLAWRRSGLHGAAVFTTAAAAGLVLPVASFYYDSRFGLPAYGVLAAAAGIGAWALVERVRDRQARATRDARAAESIPSSA
jgi:hypothetical protein